MKKKKILSLLLAFSILITGLLPITAYADTYYGSNVDVVFSFGAANGGNSIYRDKSLPFSATINDKIQNKLLSIELQFNQPVSFKSNDVLNFDLHLYSNSRYRNMDAWVYWHDANGNEIWSEKASFNQSTGKITINRTMESTMSNLYISVVLNNFEYVSNADSSVYFKVTSLTVSTKSEQSGFFENVGNWFKELFNKLQTGIDNIGSWFSQLFSKIQQGIDSIGEWFKQLGNDIKQWFQNLVDNLSQWFENVGQWFRDLWNNITVTIDNITDSIRNWWQSVVDWFHSLFVPEEGYMEQYKQNWQNWLEEHLGFLYESFVLLDDLISIFLEDMERTGNFVIHIPELKLPWNNYVILEAKEFDYTALINSNDILQSIFTMFRMVCSCLMCLFIVYLGKRKFEKIMEMKG